MPAVEAPPDTNCKRPAEVSIMWKVGAAAVAEPVLVSKKEISMLGLLSNLYARSVGIVTSRMNELRPADRSLANEDAPPKQTPL